MNQHMKLFLTELAELLNKYDIEMEAIDDGALYYPAVGGIEFGQKAIYDNNKQLREYSFYTIPT